MFLKKALLICAASLLGSAATAQDFDLRAGVSTLGLTASGSYGIGNGLAVRGLVAGFGSTDTDIDNLDLDFASNAVGDASASFNSVGLLVDYDLGTSGAFVSGGLMMMNLDLSAIATGDITLDNGANANTTVEADIGFSNDVAPMVSVGYAQDLGGNWGLYGEVGAIFTGGFDVSLTETGGNNFSQADLDAEVSSIRDDLDINAFPFVSLGASFRF